MAAVRGILFRGSCFFVSHKHFFSAALPKPTLLQLFLNNVEKRLEKCRFLTQASRQAGEGRAAQITKDYRRLREAPGVLPGSGTAPGSSRSVQKIHARVSRNPCTVLGSSGSAPERSQLAPGRCQEAPGMLPDAPGTLLGALGMSPGRFRRLREAPGVFPGAPASLLDVQRAYDGPENTFIFF